MILRELDWDIMDGLKYGKNSSVISKELSNKFSPVLFSKNIHPDVIIERAKLVKYLRMLAHCEFSKTKKYKQLLSEGKIKMSDGVFCGGPVVVKWSDIGHMNQALLIPNILKFFVHNDYELYYKKEKRKSEPKITGFEGLKPLPKKK